MSWLEHPRLKNLKSVVLHRRVLHQAKLSLVIVKAVLPENVAVLVLLLYLELTILAENV